MGIKETLKVSRKTFFNPREWLGYDSLKGGTKTIWTLVKEGATLPEPEYTETFEEAMQRLGIEEKDIDNTGQNYLIYASFFLAFAIIDFIYGFYLLFHHGAFLGLVLAVAVCGLLLAQAFKYHFWYFQIQRRKLGCTFEEWLRYLGLGRGKTA